MKAILLLILSTVSILVFTNISYNSEIGWIISEEFNLAQFLQYSSVLFLLSFVIFSISGSRSWFKAIFLTIIIPLLIWIFWHIFTGKFEQLVSGLLIIALMVIIIVVTTWRWFSNSKVFSGNSRRRNTRNLKY